MNIRLTEQQINEAYEKHKLGTDVSDLARLYKVSWNVMYMYFKRRSFKMTKGLHKNIKYKNLDNENYFSTIDNPRKAYFLGLIMADGWIRTGSNRIGIKLKKSDRNIIEVFKNELKVKNPIIEDKDTYGIGITSDIVRKDLNYYGITEQKTYKELRIPKIEECYINSFLLGFFDGDGWILVDKNNRIQIGCCGLSNNLMLEIKEYLIKYDINTKIYCSKRSLKNIKHKDLYSLLIADNPSRLKFLDLIYKDCDIYLERKYIKHLQANTVLNSKIKKLESV